MRIPLDQYTNVTMDADGNIYVTRHCIFNSKVRTHKLATKEYDAIAVALWLKNRIERNPNPMVQVAFPNMNAEDREFLMTGITPAEWNEMFPQAESEDE